MSKFGGSRNNKEVPGISSGSLSDIVFMLLFFFMVTTQMRESENKVVVKLPEASQSVKLERKDLASYINEQLAAFYKDGSMQNIAKTYGVQDALIAQ